MKAVCLLALLLVASCTAIRVTPAAQSAHPDWITPEEKMPSLPSNAASAEESAVETVSSMLETQANIKAQAATEAKTGEGGDSPSWILPLAPAGYGGPGVINPYSNVNPLNPMAAQMQAEAAGQFKAGTPQTQMGPANNNNAPVAPGAFLELESNTQGKKVETLSVRPVIEEARIRLPFGNDAAFAMPPFFPFALQATERGLPTSLRLPFPIPGLPGGQLPIPAGVHGPIVEKIDISYSMPRGGADGFSWPVVNNEVVQEHIEIVKSADDEREEDQEDDSDLMKNIAKNPNAFMTGLIRELVSGHDNAAVPAKLEVVEIPAEFNPFGGVTSGAPHLIGGLVIEPEVKDEQVQEEAASDQTSNTAAAASEASSEAASAASSQSVDVMDATPIEELPTETSSSAASTESTTAPTSEPVLPAPIESEASALLNALVQQKAQEMADELEKELVSENSESSASSTKSKL